MGRQGGGEGGRGEDHHLPAAGLPGAERVLGTAGDILLIRHTQPAQADICRDFLRLSVPTGEQQKSVEGETRH